MYWLPEFSATIVFDNFYLAARSSVARVKIVVNTLSVRCPDYGCTFIGTTLASDLTQIAAFLCTIE